MSEFSLQKYDTKETIYRTINRLRYALGISSYPINAKAIVQSCCKSPEIEYLDFDTNDICGILYKGDVSTTVALNRNRSVSQQNFDCMHEGIHYFSHDISYCKCVCSEKVIKQERSIEYQANEGAAQLLVPYELFVPEVTDLFREDMSSFDIDVRIAELARRYGVTDAVIAVRLRSLKYEISQYFSGIPVEKIRLLSDTRQRQEGITVRSILEIRDQRFKEEDMETFRLYTREANIYAV